MIHPLFQQILGAYGIQSLTEIMNLPEEARRQQQSAEAYASRIAEMRARLDRHEHVLDIWMAK